MEIHGSEAEKKLLDDINATEPWALVEAFSSVVRLSATPEERKAIDYLLSRMDALEIPYTLYEPELYVSLPVSAELEILTENGEKRRIQVILTLKILALVQCWLRPRFQRQRK